MTIDFSLGSATGCVRFGARHWKWSGQLRFRMGELGFGCLQRVKRDSHGLGVGGEVCSRDRMRRRGRSIAHSCVRRAWRIDARVGRKIKGCSRGMRADSLAALLVEPAYAACEELADGAVARVGREVRE